MSSRFMSKNKNHLGALFALGVVSVLALSACTVTYAPRPEALETPLPRLNGAAQIALINAQPDKSAREIGKAGFGTMHGDLYTWTESAIALMRAELARAGASEQSGASKTLKVAVTEAKLGVSGLNYAGSPRCSVRLRVETGSGRVVDNATEANAISPPGACDKALAQAVDKALRDQSVRSYIAP